MPAVGEDVALVDEVPGVCLRQLIEFVPPVLCVEATIILVVTCTDVEAQGYIA